VIGLLRRRIPCFFFRHVRRLIGANPRKASSASLAVSAVAIWGTGCGPFANGRNEPCGRPRPARPVRSHKPLSNSGRRCASWGDTRSGAKLPAVRLWIGNHDNPRKNGRNYWPWRKPLWQGCHNPVKKQHSSGRVCERGDGFPYVSRTTAEHWFGRLIEILSERGGWSDSRTLACAMVWDRRFYATSRSA
jgi:hypothetical protein